MIVDVVCEVGVVMFIVLVVFSGKVNVVVVIWECVLVVVVEFGYVGFDLCVVFLCCGCSGIVVVVFEGYLCVVFFDFVMIVMMDGFIDGFVDFSVGILLMCDELGEEGVVIIYVLVDVFVLIGCFGCIRVLFEVVVGCGLLVVVIEGDVGEEILCIMFDNVVVFVDVVCYVCDLGYCDVVLVIFLFDSECECVFVMLEWIVVVMVDVIVYCFEGMW